MEGHDEMRTFDSGAVRDGGKKPAMELISPHLMVRLGEWMRFACEDRKPKPYPPRNWEKGMPFSSTIGSLQRHVEKFKIGSMEEDHLAAIVFGAMALMHYQEEIKAGRLSAELDDMPHYATAPRGLDEVTRARLQKTFKHMTVTNIVPCQILEQEVLEGKRRNVAEDLTVTEASRLLEKRCVVLGSDVQTGHTQSYICHGEPVDDSDDPTATEATITVPPGTPLNPDKTLTVGIAAMPEAPGPFTVYLCGPIGGKPIDHIWREEVTSKLREYGIRTLDPLRGKNAGLISDQGLGYNGVLAPSEIADRDAADIGEADLVLACFPYAPERQSIGSLMEMGMAVALNKPVVLCATPEEFNKHLFCRRFCTIVADLSEAVRQIRSYARNRGGE